MIDAQSDNQVWQRLLLRIKRLMVAAWLELRWSIEMCRPIADPGLPPTPAEIARAETTIDLPPAAAADKHQQLASVREAVEQKRLRGELHDDIQAAQRITVNASVRWHDCESSLDAEIAAAAIKLHRLLLKRAGEPVEPVNLSMQPRQIGKRRFLEECRHDAAPLVRTGQGEYVRDLHEDDLRAED